MSNPNTKKHKRGSKYCCRDVLQSETHCKRHQKKQLSWEEFDKLRAQHAMVYCEDVRDGEDI